MIVQDDRGSLLTKGSLYKHFYRADARHEISCWKTLIFVSQFVQSTAYEGAWLNCYVTLKKSCYTYIEIHPNAFATELIRIIAANTGQRYWIIK